MKNWVLDKRQEDRVELRRGGGESLRPHLLPYPVFPIHKSGLEGGGVGYSPIWPIRGRAIGQGMVFGGLFVRNWVYNLMRVFLNQGMGESSSSLNMAYTVFSNPTSETFAGHKNALSLCKTRECVFCRLP